MNDSLGLYLSDIGKFSLLNAEEERQLARLIDAGREAAERLGRGDEAYQKRARPSEAAGQIAVSTQTETAVATESPEIDEAYTTFLDFLAKATPEELADLELLKPEPETPVIEILEPREFSAESIAVHSRRTDKVALAAAADAKDRFIRSNLRLVVSIARRYPLPQGMDLQDLIQEGNLGLEHAVDKFDWRRGFKFSTYSTFWIRQAIGRALDQKASLIRLPGDKSAALRAALRQTNISPYSEAHQLSAENAELHRLTTPASLDKPLDEGGDADLGDMMASNNEEYDPEAQLMASVDAELLDELLGTLDNRARSAVEARFGLVDGERKSFREVGEPLGVTAEAARRLVSRAVAGLRQDAIRLLAS